VTVIDKQGVHAAESFTDTSVLRLEGNWLTASRLVTFARFRLDPVDVGDIIACADNPVTTHGGHTSDELTMTMTFRINTARSQEGMENTSARSEKDSKKSFQHNVALRVALDRTLRNSRFQAEA
jgi:predicted membrane GTPase involved in stress response